MSPRAFTAIRTSPVVMVGSSSLCIEGRSLPLNEVHVSCERFNLRWPLPHVAGSPDLKVLSASLTSVRSSGHPCLCLACPYKLNLNLTDLPCSREILRLHTSGKNPGSIPAHLPYRMPGFRLPLCGIGSTTSTAIDFGAIFPFTVVPVYNLPVYASQ